MASTSALTSVSGVSSGVDWSGLVDQIISLERRPAVKMEETIAANTKRTTAFDQFRTVMSTLQTASDALKTGSTFDAFTASASGTNASGRNVLSAAASSTASAGSYSIDVVKLAQAQKTVSSVGFASSSTALGMSGGLVVGGQNVAVTSTDTLAGVRDKINALSSTTNVKATIIASNSDGTGQRLVLTSAKTGAANAFTIADDSGNSTPLASALGLDATPQVVAQDSQIRIDNSVVVTRSTNSVSDAIPGVTLSLGAEGSSTLTVSRDDSAATSAVQSFVNAYNASQVLIKAQTGDSTAPLNREAILRTTRSTLSETILKKSSGTGVASDLSTLSSIGVSIQKDGTLAFDATKFAAANTSRSADVKALLADSVGAVSTFAKGLTDAYSGMIDQRESAISTQSANLQRHIDDTDARLDKKKTALLLQYSRTEATLGKLKSIGDSLTAQLTGLNSSSSS